MELDNRPGQPHGAQEQPVSDLPAQAGERNWGPQEQAQFLEAVFAFVGEQYSRPGIETYFEEELRRAGLVEGLEQVGVLPVAPNPTQVEKRQEVLRHLFFGTALGYLAGDLLFPKVDEPPAGQASP
jgi:hypothetical protein